MAEPPAVMVGLVPTIHIFDCGDTQTWVLGTSPSMTTVRASDFPDFQP